MSEDFRPEPGRPAGIRASDEDREQLVTELHEHTVAGRLSTEELEDRLQETYAARTTSQLDEIRRDLPVTKRSTALSHAQRRAQLTRRMVQETGGSLGLFAVCLVVWLSDGAQGQFWPGWVLLVFAMSLIRNGWALFGPSPDLDAVEQDLEHRRGRRLERSERRTHRRGR